MRGPYVNLKEAAEYCGYSDSQFAALAKKYPLPRYGPSQTRFRIADLDAWMERPEDFTPSATPRRAKVSEWKPVAV